MEETTLLKTLEKQYNYSEISDKICLIRSSKDLFIGKVEQIPLSLLRRYTETITTHARWQKSEIEPNRFYSIDIKIS
jgi:hypothetical protein